MQEGPRTTVGRRSLRRQCAGPRPPLRGAIGAAGQPRTAARTRNRRTSPEARMRPGRRGQGTQLRATEVTGPTSPGGERRGESRALDVDGGAAGARTRAPGTRHRASGQGGRDGAEPRAQPAEPRPTGRERRPTALSRRPGPTYRCEAQPETRPRRPGSAAAAPHFRFRSRRFRSRDRPPRGGAEVPEGRDAQAPLPLPGNRARGEALRPAVPASSVAGGALSLPRPASRVSAAGWSSGHVGHLTPRFRTRTGSVRSPQPLPSCRAVTASRALAAGSVAGRGANERGCPWQP